MAAPSRIFLGIPVDESLQVHISAWLARAFPQGVPGRAVRPEKWHVTLLFLDELETQEIETLKEGLEGYRGPAPFLLSLDVLGAFPNPRHARVFWLGPRSPQPALVELANGLRNRAKKLGLFFDDAPYYPHLTLSRIKHRADLTDACTTPLSEPFSLPVDRFYIYESLRSGTPTPYKILKTLPLSNP